MKQQLTKAQKDGNPANPAFTFWLENKTSKEVKFWAADLRLLFQKWLRTKEKDWLEYYNSEAVVTTFLTAKDGVNATYDNTQLQEIVKLLKPDYLKALHAYPPPLTTNYELQDTKL